MNWPLIGWALIGFAVILLLISRFFRLGKNYPVREDPAIENLYEAQIAVMERGEQRKVLLGDQLSPYVYPGLGLHALSVLPTFLDRESGMDGQLTLGSADGGLVIFARQLAQSRYTDGFSPVLHQAGVRTYLYGPTPFSFTAGVLPEMSAHSGGALALFGDYGPEAMLWVEAGRKRGSEIFAAGGTLEAQAVLYLTVRNLLIGESTFLASHNLPGSEAYSKHALIEDILRWALILAMLTGVLLKLGGFL
jgi:hypothetical protein